MAEGPRATRIIRPWPSRRPLERGAGLTTETVRNLRVPFALGLAGLLPFWGLAVDHVLRDPLGLGPALVSVALALYAATILSFLGGIRWGLAVAGGERSGSAFDYVVSVLPQLWGWAAMILPDRPRFIALALALLVLGPLDRRLVARGLAPPWFGRLRLILSLGAGAALILAALA